MTCPAVVRLTVPAAPAVVRVAIPGPPGSSGTGTGGASQSVRIDSSDTNTIYVGKAAAGTAESSTGLVITRTTFSTAGVLLTTKTASGAWTARASLTYS